MNSKLVCVVEDDLHSNPLRRLDGAMNLNAVLPVTVLYLRGA